MHAGKPQKQAIAIAYSKAGKSRKKGKKSKKSSNPSHMMKMPSKSQANTKAMIKYMTGD